MEIGSSSKVNSLQLNLPKKAENQTPTVTPQKTAEVKTDGVKLSSVATSKASAIPSISLSGIKGSLSGLGEKLVNNPILDHYKSYRNDPKYAPVVAKLDDVCKNGGSIKDLEKVAFAETKKLNPNDSHSEVMAKGYRAILASVIPNHYSDPNFFNGEKDKIFHYFVSGSMTTDAYNGLKYSMFMPDAAKRAVAGSSVITLGFLKEVGSIPGNGYGADDMQANRAGIASAQNYLKAK